MSIKYKSKYSFYLIFLVSFKSLKLNINHPSLVYNISQTEGGQITDVFNTSNATHVFVTGWSLKIELFITLLLFLLSKTTERWS